MIDYGEFRFLDLIFRIIIIRTRDYFNLIFFLSILFLLTLVITYQVFIGISIKVVSIHILLIIYII